MIICFLNIITFVKFCKENNIFLLNLKFLIVKIIRKYLSLEIFKNNNMANNSVQKITAAIICANMLIFGMPASVIATEISGVTPTGNVYNIEGDKFSGSTQFRQYDKFN